MEDKHNNRAWDGLMPDILGLIFQGLPLSDKLNIVPSVCKSWAKVARGSSCWPEIDIEEWSRYRRPESIDRMLILLIGRSSGSVRKLCVNGLASEMSLCLIADHAKSLHDLRLPRSEITDSMMEQVAKKFSTLTTLDLSYCTKIGARALEAIGKHCKLLTCLKMNKHPWDVAERMSQDSEAYAISATMPQLKYLELAYLNITTDGVLRILNNCHQLERLNIHGCWNVKLDEEHLKDRSRLEVAGPVAVDCSGKMNELSDHYTGCFQLLCLGYVV